jgi:hypothetical protein
MSYAPVITQRIFTERRALVSSDIPAPAAIRGTEQLQLLQAGMTERAMQLEGIDDPTIERVLRRVLLGRAEQSTTTEKDTTT